MATQTPTAFLWSEKRHINSFAQEKVYGPHPMQKLHLLILLHQYSNLVHFAQAFNYRLQNLSCIKQPLEHVPAILWRSLHCQIFFLPMTACCWVVVYYCIQIQCLGVPSRNSDDSTWGLPPTHRELITWLWLNYKSDTLFQQAPL